MTAQAVAARGGRGLRAWAELLRAPLLLSPLADVLAGWTVALDAVARHRPLPAAFAPAPLRFAAGAGCCLLAAGMALNALVDRRDDALRKPERPLPRGAVPAWAVRVLWISLLIGGMALAAAAGRPAANAAALIVLLVIAYHGGLKRLRVPGCLALGAARGLDLLLGAGAALAWLGMGGDDLEAIGPRAFAAAGLYALYMTGAALHASTDDEPHESPWSRVGLGICLAALLLLVEPGLLAIDRHASAAAALALAVPAFALLRLLVGSRSGTSSPARTTGLLLSGLYLVDASLCFGAGHTPLALPAGLAVLALFALSRALLRVFPPT